MTSGQSMLICLCGAAECIAVLPGLALSFQLHVNMRFQSKGLTRPRPSQYLTLGTACR